MMLVGSVSLAIFVEFHALLDVFVITDNFPNTSLTFYLCFLVYNIGLLLDLNNVYIHGERDKDRDRQRQTESDKETKTET